jgi:hypothetical protein
MFVRSRAVLLVLGTFAFVGPVFAAAAPCAAKFGDVVDFGGCNPVSLPDLKVEFVGVSQPMKDIPMSCWNYEASDSAGAVAPFSQCHTGALGGDKTLSVGGKAFTVFFDVSSGCVRLPSGSWAPKVRGHAFRKGAMDAAARDAFWRKQSEEEARCFARKGAN